MPHFFISSKSLNNNKINIVDENNIFHIGITLRAKVNETIKLVDENQIVYEVKIDNISKKIIETTVLKSYKSKRISPYNISIAHGVLNSNDEYDLIKMATELGTSTIYPILTDNSSVKKDIFLKKISKFKKIAYEAAKQCERANIPNIIAQRTLDELVCDKSFDKVFIFSEIEEKYTLKDYFKENIINKNDNILIVIGPEGGFSKREFELFKQVKLPQFTLGNLILKAPTACVASISNLLYALNWYG